MTGLQLHNLKSHNFWSSPTYEWAIRLLEEARGYGADFHASLDGPAWRIGLYSHNGKHWGEAEELDFVVAVKVAAAKFLS